MAAAELGRLASLSEIHWCERDCAPPDPRVRPSQLIPRGEKVRVVHDWSNCRYDPNEALVDPPVTYADMDEFSQLLPPGAFMGGVGFQYCFLHWLVSPERRRFLGVRHPAASRPGAYLFLLFGSGPSPGRNDCCVKEIPRISRLQIPSLRIIDILCDLRHVESMGYSRRSGRGHGGIQMFVGSIWCLAQHT